MNSSTRNHLRKVAHSLSPIVMVGKNGINEKVTLALDEALASHELVKVRFQDYKDETKELAQQLCDSVKASLVGTVGHVAIIFRQNTDPKDRIVHIPLATTD
ncbi:MAG: YhbY family RNA-binding protein [Sphaerochaetaceae bacterium]|nr:YhbY family RNA-binding protein [Sphaerochaetaceae bacterium]